MEQTKFVDVLLPLSVPNLYTYRVPRELSDEIEIGKRVVVQFGGKRYYTAVVAQIHFSAPLKYEAKYVVSVLDEKPIITALQLQFWNWMASYYMCNPGDVLNAALPSCFRLASETNVLLSESRPDDNTSLTDDELLVVDALELQQILSIAEVTKITQLKNVHPLIQELLKKGFVILEEELKQKYKPKVEPYVRFHENYHHEDSLRILFDDLSRAQKQLNTVMRLVELSKVLTDKPILVKKKVLEKEADVSGAIITQLAKKGIVEIVQQEVDRLQDGLVDWADEITYSEQQKTALIEIKEQFQSKNICLLHGVTGSGKTEVFIQLIADTLAKGEQVLYLMPEIALTGQMINRLKKHFGNKVGVYHSKFNQQERVELWNKVLDGNSYQVVLGARSSLFLPFTKLGLIIVDEEHESSFKQYDPAPRYHARDAALMLAQSHQAKVLLGSATPGIETYWNAQKGNYGLVNMHKRFGGVQMPEIWCADLEKETKRKTMKGHFSSMLVEHMEATIEAGEQIILFQNRRGYAPTTTCLACGWVPQCKNCDISLTFHKYHNYLNCHYCGHHEPLVHKCPACGHVGVKQTGFGTEKIEEQLQEMFPKWRIARMDFDTTRQKHGHTRIIEQFENRQVDVLVGTQMVTKGLDFDHVGLVGVLNADQIINFPDFRSFERAYQLLTQVAGRAGRKKKRGKVIVQTFQPNHWVIQQVIAGNYEALYKQEILERKNVMYPPFVRMIKITCKAKDRNATIVGSDALALSLKRRFGSRVLGPEFPSIERVRTYYQRQMILKLPRTKSLPEQKQFIQDCIDELKATKNHKVARWVIDVDPV
jgi:primosomal protein N' (replication factor Y)